MTHTHHTSAPDGACDVSARVAAAAGAPSQGSGAQSSGHGDRSTIRCGSPAGVHNAGTRTLSAQPARPSVGLVCRLADAADGTGGARTRSSRTGGRSGGVQGRGRARRGRRGAPVNPHLISALWHLRRAFIANNRAKIYWMRSAYWYEQKERHIRIALDIIRKHSLPIKYGLHGRYGKTGEVVIYFEYLGHQVSFHTAYAWRVFSRINAKQYRGEWKPTMRWVPRWLPGVYYDEPEWTRDYQKMVRYMEQRGKKLVYRYERVRTTRFPMERILRAYIARNKALKLSA